VIAVIAIIIVGCAAAFILSRSRRQHRPIGAFRSSSDSAAFLALGGSDDGDSDGQDGDSGDSGDSGGGDGGGGDGGGGE
jgi:hypothetical protein